MSAKWTPGPWSKVRLGDWDVDSPGESSTIAIGKRDGKPIALAVVDAAFGKDSVLDANAHLIAAAPELYEALEELRDYAAKEIQRGGAHHDPVWAKAADALRKARGEA